MTSVSERRLTTSKKAASMEEGGKEDKEESKPEVRLKEFCPRKFSIKDVMQ